ncbi:MAG: sigma-54 interaction domain-containing protein [Anaerovoracaceae bacterium]|jgi:PAS domain S-box-containing protein
MIHEKGFTPIDSEELLEIIRKCSYDAFFIIDHEGTICFVNDSYERIAGSNPKNIVGKKLSILKDLGISDINLAEKVLETHQPMSMMLHYKNGKDGLVTSIPVFNDENQLIAVVGNIRDMTELNNLKATLAQVRSSSIQIREELTNLELLHNLVDDFVFNSPAMKQLSNLAVRISKVDSTVLIEGESGVGKDVYAQLINRLSNKIHNDHKPFIKISCGAIPENLLESELFGYESGSFTGAKKEGKLGIFDMAKNGIVFLDEIGEMPLTLQVKLLTVLQDREFYRIGGTKPIPMNARIIAATNRNLEDAVRQKTFREDLYFRLNVINIEIPPLRQRKEDIIPLTVMMVNRLNKKYDFQKSIDNEVLEVFERYSWPGNVRELVNVIERLIVLSPGELITVDQLPDKLQLNDQGFPSYSISEDLSLAEFLSQMERNRIIKALSKDQTLKEAAAELDIDISTLTRKINKFKIPKRYHPKHVHTEDLNLKL